ncbi:MAG: peptidylprolyl isomerase [Candidatus Krumholzibacteriota bacterium]|nr:peptidylprolyl isomerase [Candidatus Krumholzibacteriota bacterium]
MKQLLLLASIAVMLVFHGCSGDQDVAEETDYSENEIAARVNDWVVTKEKIQEAIDQSPANKQRELNTPAGRASVAASFIQEELFYQEALRHEMLETPAIQSRVKEAQRRILIAAYFTEFVESTARPNEDEIHDYYESHQDRYMMLAVARGQQIFAKRREKLEELKIRVIEGGEKFTTLAHKYSEDDLTRADGGDLGYFNPGGFVRGFGYNHALADSMFEMEIGKIYGPIKWEKGYSLIRINERRDATIKPYEEVREQIEQALTREKIEDAKAAVTQQIAGGYDVKNHLEEYYLTVQRSPAELFNVAQSTTDPNVKIEAYKEIVDKFPDDDIAPKALFMVGFVYAEELNDFLQADRTFAQVIASYPDNDMADQAKWMMENLLSGTPDFEAIEKNLDDN